MKTTKFDSLWQKATSLSPLTTAVAFPDTNNAVEGALLAAKSGDIIPTFLGDKNNIQKIAQELHYDTSSYKIIEATAQEAISKAVQMARGGEAQLIMKGSTHTDELMAEVVNSEHGLRTSKRMSHCAILDVPAYKKLLFITDGGLNIAPNLQTKKSIIQNAIDLAQAIGIKIPKVALLSAVETITNKIPSTLECAELAKMGEQGEIQNGIVEGPLSFDLAISELSVIAKKITSKVAGDADILVVPNIETGNILLKALEYFAVAENLGLILGARIPIILTSRATDAKTRANSCKLAKLYFNFIKT
jgi:phosphotransacetylase